ncbi:jg27797 [Pararge aegeria aegeria]|uniref:Jg27797 protein n=2 Tax=Pararge aegeria TaxID=116150 RepID=A0A8S4S5L6_9NEOP|nr:jg27797 [Pararge aegeria aegeria]
MEMTEEGYDGEQPLSAWDMPGPSSIAAILGSIYNNSTSSDNPPRNEEMECDPLFAESDDDVEVLPAPADESTARNVQTPKNAISSNYINSTTPTQPFEVNVTPLSAHTPVPEEYQPLPDSSSSIEYSIGRSNPDGTNASGTFNDVNIRYQPKPAYQLSTFSYRNGTNPREYIVGPYGHMNMIVLSEERNYLSQQPINYALSARPQIQETNYSNSGYTALQPSAGHSFSNFPADGNPTESRAQSLERPSRKLNISPRRKQSKETQASPNLIELSSDEEDSPSTPSKKPCDSGVGRPEMARDEATRAGNSRRLCGLIDAPAICGRVGVKAEPQDQLEVATQTTQPVAVEPQPDEPVTAHRQHYQIRNAPQIKEQSQSVNYLPRPGCGCKKNKNTCFFHNPSSEHRSNPNYFNYHNGAHHHHHHHRIPCAHNSNGASGSSHPSTSNIKIEPGTQPVIKVEVNPPRPSENIQHSSSIAATIKVEPNGQVPVKSEPTTPTPQPCNRTNNAYNSTVTVKVEESDSRRCCDGGGDRRIKASPQPGTSSARHTMQPETSLSTIQNNNNQETKPSGAESSTSSGGHVLSAPDLQLDWVSDSSSDDDVQVLGDEPNTREVIDLTSSPGRTGQSPEDVPQAHIGAVRSPRPLFESVPHREPPVYHTPPVPSHPHLLHRTRQVFPDDHIDRDLLPPPLTLDGQHIHHHMHHYLQMQPPHLHISIQPSVMGSGALATQMAALVRVAEAERRSARGASRAVIERNTYRHAYARPAPHHQDEKCTICLSIFEVESDCR